MKQTSRSINQGLYTLGAKPFHSEHQHLPIRARDQPNRSTNLRNPIVTFVQIWNGLVAQGVTNPYVANEQANSSLYQVTENLGRKCAIHRLLLDILQCLERHIPDSSEQSQLATQRETAAIQQALGTFLTNPSIDNTTKQTVELVSSGLNVGNWNQGSSISNLTITTISVEHSAQS